MTWGLWASIGGIFVIGAVIAYGLKRLADTSRALGRTEGDLAAAVRRTNENADVMQKQDELAAIAAQRDADAAVERRLRDGSF